jgi:hypothetical protein
MSDPSLSKTSEPATESEHSSTGMLEVRYGIGGVIGTSGSCLQAL